MPLDQFKPLRYLNKYTLRVKDQSARRLHRSHHFDPLSPYNPIKFAYPIFKFSEYTALQTVTPILHSA